MKDNNPIKDQTEHNDAPMIPQDEPTMVTRSPLGKRKAMLTVLAIVGLVVIGAAGWFFIHTDKNSASHNTSNTSGLTVPRARARINTWTGKGSDLVWSDAANWSVGAPANGQALVFNLADLPPNADGTAKQLNNDTSGLTFDSISFTGTASAATPGFSIAGNTLRIANGIDDSVSGRASPPLQISIHADIVLTNDAHIVVAQKAGTLLLGQAANSITFGDHTLVLSTQGQATMSLFSRLVGTGKLKFAPAAYGIVLYGVSPALTGEVAIASGYVGMNDLQALGSGRITVDDGGSLVVFSHVNPVTIVNPLTISGAGTVVDGKNWGVISSCIGPSSDNGCITPAGAQLTFGGQVTLAGDAKLSTISSNTATTKFIFTKPILGNHKIGVVPGANAEIVK